MSAASYTTRLLHTRGANLGIALLALVIVSIFYFSGNTVAIEGDRGLALPSANEWFPNSLADFAAGISASALTVFLMLLLNKIHNVLRSMTSLNIAMFAMMQAATPNLTSQFYSGGLLAVIVPLCILVLFNCYSSPGNTRQVFLIFLMLSAATLSQYCFAFYMPVMLLGCAQMRIFNWRSISAATLGIITPWWILAGFGIVDLSSLRIPHFDNILDQFHGEGALLILITAGFTTLVTILSYILNVVRTIAYNARARAINGVFTVTTIMTLAAMCLDYGNMLCYVPLLNFCAAMEVTHFFSTHRAEKSFIAILIILAAYATISICQTAI